MTIDNGGVRGRPHRSVRRAPNKPGWYGCEDQIAWLLRVNRLQGWDERLSVSARFTAEFRGGAWSAPVNPSQVSRWETGALRAGFRVLRRYEELLELEPYQLVTAADWAYRQATTRTGPPVLARDLDPDDPAVSDRASQLLERALGDAVMSGLDWDELSSHLAVLPAVFLHPRGAWADLADRLIEESLITSGVGWVRRLEAAWRLAGHPNARQPIVHSCLARLNDQMSQAGLFPLVQLVHAAVPDGLGRLLARLDRPGSEPALCGVLATLLESVGRRQLTTHHLSVARSHAAQLLTPRWLRLSTRMLAAELFRVAGGPDQPSGGPRSPVEQRRLVQGDPLLKSVLASGRTVPPDVGSALLCGVLSEAMTELDGKAAPAAELFLQRLCDDLLFSPSPAVRLRAGVLVRAVPFREILSQLLVDELAASETVNDPRPAVAIGTALPALGTRRVRARAEGVLACPATHPAVLEAVSWSIGELPGRSADRFWREITCRHSVAWAATGAPEHLRVLEGMLRDLGLAGNSPLLADIRADASVPEQTRAAADWWLHAGDVRLPRRAHEGRSRTSGPAGARAGGLGPAGAGPASAGASVPRARTSTAGLVC